MGWWGKIIMKDSIIDMLGIAFIDGGRDPKRGLDCWGTTIEAYKILNNIVLPDFAIKAYQEELISNQIIKERNSDNWVEVSGPQKGCIVTFKLHPEFVNHVGVCIDDKTFIHARDKTGVCIESFNHPLWKNKVYGFYRWIETK